MWKKAYEGEALVSSSGMVMQGIKKPHGLTLQDVKGLIKAQPDSYEYSKMIRSKVSLGEALQVRFEELGLEVDKPGTMSLLVEHDRQFEILPRTGRELLKKKYTSRPWKIEELEGI
jgi:predicted transcriptional regulator